MSSAWNSRSLPIIAPPVAPSVDPSVAPSVAPSAAPSPARLAPRIAALAAALAIAAVDRVPAPAASAAPLAQARTTVELGVYDSEIVIHTTEPKEPLVIVTDPVTMVGVTIGSNPYDPADPLKWTATYADADTGYYVPFKPGTRIAIIDGGRKTDIVVPAMDATSDPETNVVAGQVPWPGAVTVRLAVERWLAIDAAPVAPLAVTADADGRFRVDVGRVADLAPGWWGTAAVVSPEGHRFRVAFAQPFLRLPAEFGRPVVVRADAGADVRVVVLDPAGIPVLRSVMSEPTIDGLQRPIMPYDPEGQPVLWPVKGQTLRLQIDGRTAIETVMHGAQARLDPEIGTITGRAAPGAWIRTLASEYVPAKESTATVDDSGRFVVRIDPRPFSSYDSATFLVRTGPATAESYVAVAPTESVRLFGNVIDVVHNGSGPLEIVFEPASGGSTIRRFFDRAWWDNQTDYPLYDDSGRPIVLEPGDRVTSRPEGGTDVSFAIPSVTLAVAPDGGELRGSAPPGAIVSAVWTRDKPDLWGVLSPVWWWSGWGSESSAHGVVDDAGTYALPCPAPCQIAQARVRASVQLTTPSAGRPQSSLFHLAEPISGVSIDTAHLHGFATSGSQVRAALLDATDAAVEVRASAATYPAEARLPGWAISWLDRFPDGIPAGTRFGITVAGQAMTLTVPAARPIVADVLTDRVRGGGPAGDRIDVWVLPNRGDVAGRLMTRAVTTVAPDGRWSVAFADFDLRSGDDLLINSVAGDASSFFQLNVLAIDGPIEPTRTPTSEPTNTPRATATPTGAALPARGRAHLPWAGRGVTPRRGSGLPDPPFPRRESGVQHGAGAQRHVQAVAHAAHGELDDGVGQRQ